MSHDEERLEVDLEAWEPPPPPPGLADAVLARLREPVASAALEPPPRRRAGRWLVAAIAAAVAAAVRAFAAWPRDDRPSVARGVLAAAKPAHLALGPASGAELDADAAVVWERQDARIVARQLRGSTTWRVAAAETLTIETGSDAGAAVASVEATGASLRVEVQMNLMDKRTVGASAITSAAVALVTIVVYEGHVRVTGGGQTVTVVPGATVEVRPGEHPQEPRTVAGRDGRRDAPAPVACADRTQAGDSALQRADYAGALAEYQAALACGPDDDVVRKAFLAACKSRDVASARSLYGALPASSRGLIQACAAAGLSVEAVRGERALRALDPDAIRRVVRAARPQLEACAAGAGGTWRGELVVAPDGSVTRATVTPAGAVATCLEQRLAALQLEESDLGGRLTYPLAFTAAAPPAAACDRAALDASRKAAGQGLYNHALQHADRALGCGPDAVKLAFLSACNVKNTARAKALYPRLPVAARALKQRCIQMGMSPDLFP